MLQQCLWLLRVSGIDSGRLRSRAGDESLAIALDALERTAGTIEHDAAKLELWEITDLAKSLRSAGNEP